MPKMISNPKAGTEDGLPQVNLPFECASAVTAKQVVSINTTGKILTAAIAVDLDLVVGIALETGVTGSVGLVCVLGRVDNVPADGAIAAGQSVIRSGTTAGRVIAAAGTEPSQGTIGVAISAAAAGVVDLYVNKA